MTKRPLAVPRTINSTITLIFQNKCWLQSCTGRHIKSNVTARASDVHCLCSSAGHSVQLNSKLDTCTIFIDRNCLLKVTWSDQQMNTNTRKWCYWDVKSVTITWSDVTFFEMTETWSEPFPNFVNQSTTCYPIFLVIRCITAYQVFTYVIFISRFDSNPCVPLVSLFFWIAHIFHAIQKSSGFRDIDQHHGHQSKRQSENRHWMLFWKEYKVV